MLMKTNSATDHFSFALTKKASFRINAGRLRRPIAEPLRMEREGCNFKCND